jgi:hypothetical protein
MPNDTCDSLHAGYTSDVIFIRDFAFTVFGKFVMFGEEKMTERAFLFTK